MYNSLLHSDILFAHSLLHILFEHENNLKSIYIFETYHAYRVPPLIERQFHRIRDGSHLENRNHID